MSNDSPGHAAGSRHLDDEEVVAAIDGDLAADRASHLAACAACHETVASLASVVQSAADVDVPEPSPLFWEHLSTRVRDGIAEPAPASPGVVDWLRRPAAAWSLASAALLIWIVAYQPFVRNVTGPVTDPAPSGAAVPGAGPASPAVSTGLDTDADSDEAWGLVRALADDLVWDDAHDAGISARPGSADGMALELTAAEQDELTKLLHAELKRAGA